VRERSLPRLGDSIKQGFLIVRVRGRLQRTPRNRLKRRADNSAALLPDLIYNQISSLAEEFDNWAPTLYPPSISRAGLLLFQPRIYRFFS